MNGIVIAGGGTGGHISPAIAVSESVSAAAPWCSIDFIGSNRPIDLRMYSEFGSAFHPLDPPRMDRGTADLLALPFRVVPAYLRARKLLRELRPAVLLSTGGYPSFFPCLAASRLGLPVFVHESNSVPGRANRMAARFATTVLTGFSSAGEGFRRPVINTGNPVRSSLRRIARSEARDELGLPADGYCVLFLGGSQGAGALNEMALEAPDGVSVLLQCGSRNEESVRAAAAGSDGIFVTGFVDDPSALYSAADLAVARAGSMTIAELSWFRLPSVLVPYPLAADGHQLINASEVAAGGGALVMEQEGLEPDTLWSALTGLLEDGDRRSRMSLSLERMMPGNPADLIAGMLLEAIRSTDPDPKRGAS